MVYIKIENIIFYKNRYNNPLFILSKHVEQRDTCRLKKSFKMSYWKYYTIKINLPNTKRSSKLGESLVVTQAAITKRLKATEYTQKQGDWIWTEAKKR